MDPVSARGQQLLNTSPRAALPRPGPGLRILGTWNARTGHPRGFWRGAVWPVSIATPTSPSSPAANACRSLYWRSTAQTPHGASIGGWSPGHVSSSGARDTGDWMVAPGGLLRLREIIPRSHPERYRGLVATREALPVAWHAPTDSPRGSGRAGQGGGEVRRYRGSRVMPAEGRDLRWKRWRKGAGSRERPNGLSPRR